MSRIGEPWTLAAGAVLLAAACTSETGSDAPPCDASEGVICTYLGNGEAGLGEDGVGPHEVSLYLPQDLTFGPDGQPYVVDWNNHRIRTIAGDVVETVIGTGSSGVQAITAIAGEAAQTYVFQRTANYSVPARNRPADPVRYRRLAGKVKEVWEEILNTPGGLILPPVGGKAGDYPPEQRMAMLEERWAYGGQSILGVFADQGVDPEVNELVAEFVRQKTRERIDDPELAEKLVCTSYPIGVKRICIDTGYYECFNQDNVHLVDIKEDPIERITATGIRLRSGEHIELDTIVFALGFNAFTGALDEAGVTNEHGQHPSDNWKRGPRTFLGLTTTGFPNLFIITGPGSPSVLANMNLANVQHMDFVGDLIAYMNEHGYTRVEPTKQAEDAWTQHCAELAEPLLRRKHDNYMVHVNSDDGSRVFIPYIGGMAEYVRKCNEVVAGDYEGFDFK